MWKLARNLFPVVLKSRSKFNWHFHKLSGGVMFYVYILSLQELPGLIRGTGHSLPFAFYHVTPWFTLLLQEVIEISSCHALHIECEKEKWISSTYALQASNSCWNSRYKWCRQHSYIQYLLSCFWSKSDWMEIYWSKALWSRVLENVVLNILIDIQHLHIT